MSTREPNQVALLPDRPRVTLATLDFPLNRQKSCKHHLLILNALVKFLIERFLLGYLMVLLLLVHIVDQKLVQRQKLPQLGQHIVFVRFVLAFGVQLVVDVLLVTATINFHRLQERHEFFERRRPRNA